MPTKKDTKIDIDKIIAEKANLTQEDTKKFYSEELQGELLIKKIPRNRFQKLLSMVQNEEISDDEAENKMVYEFCPELQNEKLLKAFDVTVPYDVIPKIFNDNIFELSEIRKIILSFYGYKEAIENAKKQ